MNARIPAFWLVLLLASPLFARDQSDVIIMKNGDRITCEIKGLAEGTLYISVDYILNTSSVDWSKVDHLESKQLFLIKTQDGLAYSGTLSTPETPGGRPIKIQILEPSDNKVEVDKMTVVRMDETSSNFWQRLNGEIGMNGIYSKGNESAQYSLNSEINYPRERWAVGANYTSTLSSSTGTSPSTRNEVNVNAMRLLRWDNWYYTGIADLLMSSEQGIQLQSTFGTGVGRFLKNTNHAAISVVGGLAWQQIDYMPSVVPAPTQYVTSGLVSSQVRLFWFNKTTLSAGAYLLPALTEPGRVHFSLKSSYYVKLWSNLTWNISFYGNWDNRPPPGFSGSDYGTSSGLSWTFGNH